MAGASERSGPTMARINSIQEFLQQSRFQPLTEYRTGRDLGPPPTQLPHEILDIAVVLSKLKMKIVYIKSGSTGHTFVASTETEPVQRMAIKVTAYPKDVYGDIDDLRRPENLELVMLSLLSGFVTGRRTPHLVLPITSFRTRIERFIGMSQIRNEMYHTFVHNYHQGAFEPYVSVLFSEWCEEGDLLDYVRDHYRTMTLQTWTVLIAQVLLTLASIQRQYPSFRHNDLKANNILLQKTVNETDNRHYRYRMGGHEFLLPHISLEAKIWDFDFACIEGVVDNSKIDAQWEKEHNISQRPNRYYDIHYLFSSLAYGRLFSHWSARYIPPEIVAFVERVVPEELRPCYQYEQIKVDRKRRNGEVVQVEKRVLRQQNPRLGEGGRVRNNSEYTTPERLLLHDPLFAPYRRLRRPG